MMRQYAVMTWLVLLVAAPSLVSPSCYTCDSVTSVRNHWTNNFDAEFSIPISSQVTGGWSVGLTFSKPVTNLQIWRANVESVNSDSSVYILKNKPWNRKLSPGRILEMNFLGEFSEPVPSFTVRLVGQQDCGQSCSADGLGFDVTTPRPRVMEPLGCRTCCSLAEVVHEWPVGNFDGKFVVPIETQVVGGWEMELIFSSSVSNMQVYDAIITDILNGGTIYRLKNKHYNADLASGTDLVQRFQASASSTPSFTAHMTGQPECCVVGDLEPCNPSTTAPPTTTTITSAPTTSPVLVCPTTEVIDQWPGNFKGEFVLPIRNQVTDGWTVELEFSEPVYNFQACRADIVSILNDGMTIVIKNRDFNADLNVGSRLQEQFQASAVNTPKFTARMIGQPDCSEPTATEEGLTTLGEATAEPTVSPSNPPTTKPSEPRTEPPTTSPSEPSRPSENPTTIPTSPSKTPFSESPSSPPNETPTTRPSDPPTENPRQQSTAPSETPAQSTTVKPVSSTAAVTEGTTQRPSSAPYNYAKVLHKSILFYEAQRSGDLPQGNRIPWRYDSTLTDKGTKGEDLSGGWFDAGDYVKFGLPMASSATVLAWGLIEYRDAYEASGELDYMLDCIRWATDYFLKCHTGPNEFYGQVGNGQEDHGYWGRPEDMTLTRPAYKLTANNPGSEVVGETAAALAAASIAFRETDPAYADTLLLNAEQLYEFANVHRGKYTDAIPDARNFYESYSGYGDELAWSAAWLYRATNDVEYLVQAETHYNDFGIGNENPWGFSWDDKKAGVMLLLYQLTNSEGYKSAITGYLDSWQPGRIQYTPKGLAFRSQWGSNRYAANTAFLALVAADAGIDEAGSRHFAKGQINYMLGDSGRSYVVGFGESPPDSPHHGSSSCPDKPQPCGWAQFHESGPNPQVLEGALVGGPDQNDVFVNDRTDYIHNEVATDYNAGFQSAVAGLKSLDTKGIYDA